MIGTAALSSLITVGLVVLFARTRGPGFVEGVVGEAGDALASKVRSAVEEAADGQVPRLREQVREGCAAGADEALPRFRAEIDQAVEEALPRFRDQMREGFKEALVDVASGRVLETAGEKLVERGSSVVEAGLDLFFGKRESEE
jgi:hypothetical protein